MRRIWTVLMVVFVAFGTAACSDETQNDAERVAQDAADEAEDAARGAADAAQDAADRAEDVVNDETVNIDDNAYDPADIEVTRGTEVTWVNQDGVEHTVTHDDDVFGSERLGEGDEFSHRFVEEGDYPYFCEVHGKDTMSGTVTVTS